MILFILMNNVNNAIKIVKNVKDQNIHIIKLSWNRSYCKMKNEYYLINKFLNN